MFVFGLRDEPIKLAKGFCPRWPIVNYSGTGDSCSVSMRSHARIFFLASDADLKKADRLTQKHQQQQQGGYDNQRAKNRKRQFHRHLAASSDRDRGPDRDSDDGGIGDALRGAGHHCRLEPKDKKQQRP